MAHSLLHEVFAYMQKRQQRRRRSRTTKCFSQFSGSSICPQSNVRCRCWAVSSPVMTTMRTTKTMTCPFCFICCEYAAKRQNEAKINALSWRTNSSITTPHSGIQQANGKRKWWWCIWFALTGCVVSLPYFSLSVIFSFVPSHRKNGDELIIYFAFLEYVV